MNPGRISLLVTNFADEIGGNVHVAVLPAQFRSDLLGPGTDAAVDFRIERFAYEDVLIHGFFVGLLLGDALCRFHGVLLSVQCNDNPIGQEVQVALNMCLVSAANQDLRRPGYAVE
jgi:hypothetical protein